MLHNKAYYCQVLFILCLYLLNLVITTPNLTQSVPPPVPVRPQYNLLVQQL